MILKRISFINPLFILLTIWSINILFHLLVPEIYGVITFLAVFCVLLYLIFFSVGYVIGFLPKINIKKNEVLIPRKISKYLIFFFGILLSYNFFLFLKELRPESLVIYRNLVNSSFIEKNTLFWLLRLFSLLFFYANIQYFISSGKKRIIWGMIALLTSVIGSGRNYLLIFILTVVGVNVKEPNKSILKVITLAVLMVTVLFGSFVVLFEKSEEGHSVMQSIWISLSSYLFNPLHGFSEITSDIQNWGTTMLISPGILDLFGVEYTPIPMMPYTNPPAVTNVYTMLWPMYYDLGFLGIIFFGLFYGFIHSYLYRGFKSGKIYFSYLYVLSLYPLVMSIFHDVYISSVGLWLAAIIPLMLFKNNSRVSLN